MFTKIITKCPQNFHKIFTKFSQNFHNIFTIFSQYFQDIIILYRMSSIECRVSNVEYRMPSIECRVSNVERINSLFSEDRQNKEHTSGLIALPLCFSQHKGKSQSPNGKSNIGVTIHCKNKLYRTRGCLGTFWKTANHHIQSFPTQLYSTRCVPSCPP